MTSASDIPPGTWQYIVMGLCAAISALCLYIAKGAEQRRRDHKEERDVLLKIAKDSTAAITKLSGAVDRLQQTFDQYIHEDH